MLHDFVHSFFCFIWVFSDATSKKAVEADDSTEIETMKKRNRGKRAAKDELTPLKMKRIKVSQDTIQTYDKFVSHGRKLKRPKKDDL
jgi:hypothetical protein